MKLPQGSENLRYLLWDARIRPEAWAAYLAEWAGCEERRALALLHGTPLTDDEQQRIAERAELSVEELQLERLVEGGDIVVDNLRYLFGVARRGDKSRLAERLGVDPGTISKWLSGDRNPSPAHLQAICRELGLGRDIDLRTDPLFLSLTPVTDLQRRAWLHERIDQIDRDTLAALFPAFERLLEER